MYTVASCSLPNTRFPVFGDGSFTARARGLNFKMSARFGVADGTPYLASSSCRLDIDSFDMTFTGGPGNFAGKIVEK